MANAADAQIFDVDFARKQFPYFDLSTSDEWGFPAGLWLNSWNIFTGIIRFSLMATMRWLTPPENRWTVAAR